MPALELLDGEAWPLADFVTTPVEQEKAPDRPAAGILAMVNAQTT